jgi:hypothetical protein
VKSAYDRERGLLNGWARWCYNGNHGEIMRLCGLTWAGSPPNTMDSIYVMGERTKDDVTGFAPDPPPLPDTDSQAIDRFMSHLREILPSAYNALIARHLRVVHGEFQRFRAEIWIAQALYCLSPEASRQKLKYDCDRGYSSLQQWWNAQNRNTA